MNIKLESVTERTLDEFAEMKVKLIKYHLPFSEKLGFTDEDCVNYNYKDAIKHFKEEGYHQYILKDELEKIIGFVEIQQTKSNIHLSEKCISIKNLYFETEYRNKGYLRELIGVLQNRNKNLELECYYELPAHIAYKQLGFKRFKTHYFL